MIRVAQVGRGEHNGLGEFARPSETAKFPRIKNRRRVIARPDHEPREWQDGVMLRRQRPAVTQDVIFVARMDSRVTSLGQVRSRPIGLFAP